MVWVQVLCVCVAVCRSVYSVALCQCVSFCFVSFRFVCCCARLGMLTPNPGCCHAVPPRTHSLVLL